MSKSMTSQPEPTIDYTQDIARLERMLGEHELQMKNVYASTKDHINEAAVLELIEGSS